MISKLTTWLNDATFSIRNTASELAAKGLYNIAKEHGKSGARTFAIIMFFASPVLIGAAIYREVGSDIADFYTDCWKAIKSGEL